MLIQNQDGWDFLVETYAKHLEDSSMKKAEAIKLGDAIEEFAKELGYDSRKLKHLDAWVKLWWTIGRIQEPKRKCHDTAM